MHTHDHFEVLLQISGRRVQHYDKIDISAEAGHLVFIPPGLRHGATLMGPSSSLLLAFNLAYLHNELAREASTVWSHTATLNVAPELLPFAAQPHMRFECRPELFNHLQARWSALSLRAGSDRIGAAAYARSLVSLLLLDVVDSFEEEIIEAAQNNQSTPISNRIDTVKSIISRQFASRLSVEDVARQMNMSPSCLTARIKRVTGRTFGDLLTEARLLRSRELLIYTDKRISDIVFECGFEDHAFFSRKFRKEIGTSPVKYRRDQNRYPDGRQLGTTPLHHIATPTDSAIVSSDRA